MKKFKNNLKKIEKILSRLIFAHPPFLCTDAQAPIGNDGCYSNQAAQNSVWPKESKAALYPRRSACSQGHIHRLGVPRAHVPTAHVVWWAGLVSFQDIENSMGRGQTFASHFWRRPVRDPELQVLAARQQDHSSFWCDVNAARTCGLRHGSGSQLCHLPCQLLPRRFLRLRGTPRQWEVHRPTLPNHRLPNRRACHIAHLVRHTRRPQRSNAADSWNPLLRDARWVPTRQLARHHAKQSRWEKNLAVQHHFPCSFKVK